MKEIDRKIYEMTAHTLLLTILIANTLFLIFKYDDLKSLIIAETALIPLLYLCSYIGCKLGDK